jgi:hypothetical protein
MSGGTLAEVEAIRAAQIATLTAGVWTLLWLLVRRRFYTREGVILIGPASAGPLLLTHVALAIGGNLALLGGAVAVRGNVLVKPTDWSIEAGSALGGAALLTALAAFALWHRHRGELLSWQAPFFIGLTLPVWLSCAAERALPGAGYRALLLTWPAYLLAWCLSSLRPNWRQKLFPRVTFADTELPIAVALASIFTTIVATNAVWEAGGYSIAGVAAVVTALSFAVLAVAGESEGLAFVAASLGNVAASLFVAQVYRDQSSDLTVQAIVRANIVASSVGAIIWLAMRRYLRIARSAGPLLRVQSVLGLVANSLFLLLPLASVVFDPGGGVATSLRPEYPISGWPALLLAAVAAFWHARQIAPERRLDVIGIGWLSAGVLLACHVWRWDSGNWLSYHVLTASWALLGLAGVAVGSIVYALRTPGGADFRREPQVRWLAGLVYANGIRRWVEISGAGVAALSFWGAWGDPYSPYSSAAGTLLVSVLFAALAIWFRQTRHVWTSGLLFNLTGIVIWLGRNGNSLDGFLLTNVIGLALAGAFWTSIDLVLRADRPSLGRGLGFARFALWSALAMLVWISGSGLITRLSGGPFTATHALVWPGVTLLAIAFAIALWDTSSLKPALALYLLGLSATAFGLQETVIDRDALLRSTVVALAVYASVVALFRSAVVPRIVEELRLPIQDAAWFAPAQSMLAVIVTVAGAWISIAYPALRERLVGAEAVALVLPALALLPGAGPVLTLALAVVALVEVALAVPDLAGPALWLDRTALVFFALVVSSLTYAELLPTLLRRRIDWLEAARRVGDATLAIALATLALLITQEVVQFDPDAGRTAMARPEIALVALSIVALVIASIRCALNPNRDPLRLGEDWRTSYVYAAEVLVVVIIAHLRMTAPELFSGWIAHYWTLLVMLVGFLAMGLSEYFDLKGVKVLAEPLRRTGLVLPAVPLTAYWLGMPLSPAGAFPQDLGQYAVLWLLVALLYALAASFWHSTAMALLSALALNFGLWSLLANNETFAFRLHPQLWLIPPALILLVAEYLNRERLSAETAAGLRYLGICTIYVSSTADHFIAGLGNSVILPLALAALAVAGVLAGIALRVRAFLFMGVSFLLLDILTMIWHAAVDLYHTWVWWVSGIVLGAAILALFAVFEKRRKDVLQLIDEIKAWH